MIISKEGLDIQQALQYVPHFSHATDPRDKIYGLYGIASGVDDIELAPDYKKSVAEVYVQTTRHLITKNNSLQLLVDAGVGYHRDIQLPSWVPNYNFPRSPNRITFGRPEKNIYNASGSSSPIIHWTTGSNDLTLSGAIIDTVECLGTNSTSMNTAEIREWMLEAFHLVEQFNETTPEPISEEDLWRTMIGNRTQTSIPAEAAYGTLFEYFRYWCQNPEVFIGMGEKGLDNEIGNIYKKAHAYFLAAADLIEDRKFGITRNGHPGILPITSAVDDKVAIILGLSTPFIVRECPRVENNSREQKYVLVGECYLYNLMWGEGLKWRAVQQLILQ
jgi:hypothetical protein